MLHYSAPLTAAAKQMCRRCPLRTACAEWVAAHPQDDGVYAAMTPKDRDGLDGLLADAGGDMGRALARFDDREALAVGRKAWRHGFSHTTAAQIVGAAAVDRARLVLRWTPDLADKVAAGEVSLLEAAVRAQAVADEPREKVAA